MQTTDVKLLDENEEVGKMSVSIDSGRDNALLYTVEDNPPWLLSFVLGFQQYLLMFGSIIGVPVILGSVMCFEENAVVKGQLLQTTFFCCGLATLLQTTFGVRLPIVQGSSFAVIVPVVAFMKYRSTTTPCINPNNNYIAANVSGNGSFPVKEEEYLIRFRMLQGSFMVSSLFQIGLGFSGIIGSLLRFIGPLTIAPTIALITLPLFGTVAHFCESQWGVALAVSFFIILFSQVLKEVKVPLGCTTLEIFKVFPVIFSIVIGWGLCAILTYSGALSEGSVARVDSKSVVLETSPWLRIPYPGQWGMPSINVACIISIASGLLASIIESIGDYYACARIAGAAPPPTHAINRGIGFEGIGVFITGAWGTGTGSTSHSSNIAAVGITRVGSLRVIQCGGIIMIVLSIFGKIGAGFTLIPNPVVGGIFAICFGTIAAVGLSSLQFVDLSSIRNLLVFGVALFTGLLIPEWVKRNGNQISVGNDTANDVIRVLLSINMLVGGFTACALDNLLPGTLKERGLLAFHGGTDSSELPDHVASIRHYDPPFLPKRLMRCKVSKYLPFMPYYDEERIPIHRENVTPLQER